MSQTGVYGVSENNGQNGPSLEIDLDAFIAPVESDRIAQLRAEVEADRKLIREYFESGLTMSEFARRKGLPNYKAIENLLISYDIPCRLIDAQAVKRIKAQARKRKESVLCENPKCLPCQILRAQFEKQSKKERGY